MTESEKCSVRIALKEVEAFNRLPLLRRICSASRGDVDRIREGLEPEQPSSWRFVLDALPICLCQLTFPDPPEWSEP